MSRRLTFVVRLIVVLGLSGITAAQAPPSLTSARVAYMTRKAVANPQGDLKETLSALERELGEAIRLGRTGEARRLLAKGMALLAGTPWTEQLEYARSLVLRTDRTIADSSKPFVARLEQIYGPSLALPRSLAARASLDRRPQAAPRGGAAPAASGQPSDAVVRTFGPFEPVARDLRDTPFVMELDLAGIEDGTYRLRVDVLDGEQVLGSTTLVMAAFKGLDERLARLASGAASVPEAVRADVLSPVDIVRNVNLSRISLGALELGSQLAGAEAVLAAAKSGRDPFAGRTGDITRHYVFEPSGEILPYRLYVPTGYDKTRPLPLIVALHGLGANEGSFFESYGKRLPLLAEQHGYIVVAPLGYRPDGFYGWGVGEPPADLAARQLQERSEQDVMEVLARVRKDYRIDPSRIYLMGHSMGAIGTWRLAAKYPDIWAAVAPISGSGAVTTVEKMQGIPQIVVHGDKDPTVPVTGSRTMVAEMKRLGMEVQYIEVPGGDHLSVVVPNLEAVVAFFDAHKKAPRSPGPVK
jgi:poly(3-hydroxybutyrate) depolymerase